MGKYEQLAKDIIKNVGGVDNINGLTHCITRLRFKLKDESKANDDVLKNMDGVVTVMHSAGQYQVVIGNHVPNVYADVCEIAGIGGDTQDAGEAPKGVFNKLIDIISGCFQPILGPMCAAGIIKGLNALLVFLLGASYSVSGTYAVLNAIGDAVFYFMPVILGYTAAKKFNVNPITGMLIGAALCYPNIQASTLSAAGEAIGSLPVIGDYYTTFLGIPFVAGDYTSSVVPVLVIVALAGQIQKVAKKTIPEMLQGFFVPFFVLLISLPIGLLIIGPIVGALTDLLSQGFANLYAFSPVLTGLTVGLLWQCLVIFGLHWALVPLAMVNLTTMGYDTILVGMFGTTFAQTAVIIAMYFKMKDAKRKALAIPAIVSGVCGVTEPAIYGFSLPEKTPFVFSCIGAAAGGAVMTLLGAVGYTMGGLGIFGVVNYISPAGDASGMYAGFACIVVSMVVAFLLTFFFWKDKSVAVEETEKKTSSIKMAKDIVASPLKGKVIAMSDLKDDAFAQGALGKGVGIVPTDGKVVAPVDGTVTTLFPTLHAIGITADSGVEVLIHIGLDTVQLEGKGFKAHVAQGDKIVKGQPLVDVDLKVIEEAGFSTETPVIITNSNDLLDVIETSEKEVNQLDELITVLF